MKYITYSDRKTWLEARKHSLGASESAAAVGMSRYSTREQLWKEKTEGISKDISDVPAVIYGTYAEEHMRALFALKHAGEYAVEYYPHRIYHSDERPYMTCTLDGEIIRRSDGARGIYECKTSLIRSVAMLDEWNGRIPTQYYIQVCHQLYVMADRQFAILNAELRFPDNGAEIREYEITREECEEDILFLLPKCDDFWSCVKNKRKPALEMRL